MHRLLTRTIAPVRAAVVARAALPAARAVAAQARAMSTGEADSHDDFKPKAKFNPADPAAMKTQVDALVASSPVVLFMKGTPQQPMCGFSAQVVRILNSYGVDIHGVDILSNAALRTYMKEYSSWPTFPQLYIKGEFVGGCDITTEMHKDGSLKGMLDKAK